MYSRELDDKTLTLAPSGWTHHRTFVLYDRETETLWYPMENEEGQKGLRGVAGPLQDEFLPELESEYTSWDQWKRKHPDTGFMEYTGFR